MNNLILYFRTLTFADGTSENFFLCAAPNGGPVGLDNLYQSHKNICRVMFDGNGWPNQFMRVEVKKTQ